MSHSSGKEIYNRVLVTGQSPAGEPVSVERTQGLQSGAVFAPVKYIAANQSFDVDASGWTATGSVITRDTTTFDSGPAAGRWDTSGASDPLAPNATLEVAFDGTFVAGVTYRLRFAMRANVSHSTTLGTSFGAIGQGDSHDSSFFTAPPTTFTVFAETWTPTRTYTSGVTFRLTRGPTTITAFYWIDSLELTAPTPTLVDRRGFRRTKVLQVRATLPADGVAAAQIGDTWLAGHKRTPFKGTVKLTGDTAVRDRLTGAPVPLERLLLATGELIEFTDRVDPDTGSHGRVGRIAEVVYDHAKNEATVTLDNTRSGFEALLERLAVVTGGGA